jgi:hypothetical protein
MYQKMYSTLFNAITDALEQLERKNISSAEDILKAAQCAAEEIYISWDLE